VRIAWLVVGVAAAGCVPRLYTDDAGGEGEPWAAPENRWPVGAPPEGLEGEGLEPGDVAVDVRGPDQFGDLTSLWQFHGRWILVDISTMWCSPCQDLAKGTEEVQREFESRGFTYLTLLHENVDNEPPSVDDLKYWATVPSFGDGPYDLITAPIVADPRGRSGSASAVRANTYPVVLLVGPDLRVVERVEPPTEERVIEVLEERLPPG